MHETMKSIKYGTSAKRRKALEGELFVGNSSSQAVVALSSPPSTARRSMLLRRTSTHHYQQMIGEEIQDRNPSVFGTDLPVILQPTRRKLAAHYKPRPKGLFQITRPQIRLKGEGPLRIRRQQDHRVQDPRHQSQDFFELTNASPISTDEPQANAGSWHRAGAAVKPAKRHCPPDMSVSCLKFLRLQRDMSNAIGWSPQNNGDGFTDSELRVDKRTSTIRHRRPRKPRPSRHGRLIIVEERSCEDPMPDKDTAYSISRRMQRPDETRPLPSSPGIGSTVAVDPVQQLLQSITAPPRSPTLMSSCVDDTGTDKSAVSTGASQASSSGSSGTNSASSDAGSEDLETQSSILSLLTPFERSGSSQQSCVVLRKSQLMPTTAEYGVSSHHVPYIFNSDTVVPRTSQRAA